MKKLILTLAGLAIVAVVITQSIAFNNKPSTTGADESAIFSWKATIHDFGKIKIGVPVTHQFSFINSGKTPLVITSVQASCGCTVTSYSKDAIAPGASGYVTATYNAAKAGQFTKSVSVNANTEEGLVQLTIKGEVVD
ncbi:DUF1573 domain-containing protein [Chryseosolibacter indicus]|uniref:DUF1573 domain-containing protein n=1 Tax=Chryseosolibacter indicus TaxID=2782351 RepID=A0ABS5VX91_9BACT|nr:DUF1573 domain-containing protein [Chryseosolibacter indicus]MBT1706029.1 DUF1573 domain-containing protein [Chryseosolibacter indicus]